MSASHKHLEDILVKRQEERERHKGHKLVFEDPSTEQCLNYCLKNPVQCIVIQRKTCVINISVKLAKLLFVIFIDNESEESFESGIFLHRPTFIYYMKYWLNNAILKPKSHKKQEVLSINH